MDSKKPWESKTIVVNCIVGLIAALAPFFPGGPAALDFAKAHLVEFGVIWSIANVALRAFGSNIALGE